jgi:uncharacterized protein
MQSISILLKSPNVLKERYAGQMDFSKASSIVKEILQ